MSRHPDVQALVFFGAQWDLWVAGGVIQSS